MAKAVNTINTIIKFGTSSSSLSKMCPITSYPDLFGDPETIEVTDLEDTAQTFIPGVTSTDTLQFEANYVHDTFVSLKANERTDGYFELDFGADGVDGKFTWQGQYTLGIQGKGNNEARTMTINCVPSTIITVE